MGFDVFVACLLLRSVLKSVSKSDSFDYKDELFLGQCFFFLLACFQGFLIGEQLFEADEGDFDE